MVSAGFGITLLPEICLGVEARSREIKVIRFVDPEPSRAIGLAWRRSSPRRDDFLALSKLIAAAGQASQKRGVTATQA
jgi:LysR family hydrogen peroxide-inducible transcriptional activator